MRLTHKPTGIVVSMQDEKSQLQNREKAMRVLRARLYERKLAEQAAEIAAERRSQVGTGERSEKIRTYNFPQGRVTDHRVKLTAHNLDEILGGSLDEFTGRARGRGEAGAARGPDRRAADGPGDVRRLGGRRPGAATDALGAAGVESPRLDAELLLAEATGRTRAQLAAAPGPTAGGGAAAGVRRAGAPPAAARAGRLHHSGVAASATSSSRSTAAF